jgi:GR25 family glycosyltransferase involved in LPS biosynthesis
MRAFYINLDSQLDRRASIESSFAACRAPGWTLARFPAIHKDEVTRMGIPGTISPAEKACFLSHRTVMENSLRDTDPIFILEDDAVFSPSTFPVIDRFLATPSVGEWDILFTDMIVPRIETMAALVRLRRELIGRQEVKVLDISRTVFAGSTAYLINGRSKAKIYDMLARFTELNQPYDLVLRHYIHQSSLHGHVFFPFITGLGDCSASSQIQRAEVQMTELIWSTFRRMIWLERSLDKERDTLKQLQSALDPQDCAAFGLLFSAMVSSNYQSK